MRRAGVPAFALALAMSSLALAEDVDPTRVTRIAVGPPRDPHPMARIDVGRTGRVAALPEALVAEGRLVVAGGLDVGIAVASGGDVIAATASGDLVRIDASEKERWRTRLPSSAVHAPVLLTNGTAVVITDAGECVGVGDSGEIRFRVALPSRGRDVKASPLATSSGGVVIAAGRSLVLLDGGGAIAARARAVDVPIGDLLADDGGLVMTTESGRVIRWRAPDPPVVLGSLGGALSAPASLAGGILAAVVDGSRLVTFDLAAGALRASVQASTLLEGSPSIAGGRIWIAAGTSALVAYSTDGRELERTALPPSSTPSFLDTGTSVPPAMLVTDDGAAAFARINGELGIASASSARMSETRGCSDPLGLYTAAGRVLVACRDGSILRYAARGP